LLEDDQKFGFIVMDGNGCLFGTVFGNTREVIHKLSVELPKKHGRGGQSALRFARLRLEKRHNYLAKVAELCTQLFVTENRINVTGLVLAGSAEFKNDLQESDLFDPRLKSKVPSARVRLSLRAFVESHSCLTLLTLSPLTLHTSGAQSCGCVLRRGKRIQPGYRAFQ
jgi:peptide subunit release factor 1 (eRF1)